MINSSPDIETPVVKRPRSRIFAGVTLIVAVLLILLRARAFFDGRDLRFVEESPLEFLSWIGSFFAVSGILVTGPCFVIYRAIKYHCFSYVHFFGPVFLLVIWFTPGDLYLMGVKKRLFPIDEARYMHFAQDIRAIVAGTQVNYISLDSKHIEMPEEKTQEVAAMKVLTESVFMDWPRQFLEVRIDDDSVTLVRSTGMLGSIGVKIFDGLPQNQTIASDSDGDRLSLRVLFIRGD